MRFQLLVVNEIMLAYDVIIYLIIFLIAILFFEKKKEWIILTKLSKICI